MRKSPISGLRKIRLKRAHPKAYSNWHHTKINLCPSRYLYVYKEIPEDFEITEEILRIHLYSNTTGDALYLDNIKIAGHLDPRNPENDGDGIRDGKEVMDGSDSTLENIDFARDTNWDDFLQAYFAAHGGG